MSGQKGRQQGRREGLLTGGALRGDISRSRRNLGRGFYLVMKVLEKGLGVLSRNSKIMRNGQRVLRIRVCL